MRDKIKDIYKKRLENRKKVIKKKIQQIEEHGADHINLSEIIEKFDETTFRMIQDIVNPSEKDVAIYRNDTKQSRIVDVGILLTTINSH
jgi:ectoine hydroxylase-related dioxygenase (phytanoyl-CoA dioxygenase family)